MYADQSEQTGYLGGEDLKRLELKLSISDRWGIQYCSGNNEKGHRRTLARLILYNETIPAKKQFNSVCSYDKDSTVRSTGVS